MTPTDLLLYYALVFAGLLYAFYKRGVNKTSIFVILIFWEGFVDYVDTVVGMGVLSGYKIAVVGYAILLLWKTKRRLVTNRADVIVNVVFLLFTASYWLSYYLYGGSIVTILSQYLYKYAMVWFAYHYFKDIVYNVPEREYVKRLLLTILYIQIAISIWKILLMGFNYEGLVGSMSFGGGGPAVVIPIVALIFYWTINNGRFTQRDWIIVALILTLSIASGKRQPIIIYPAVLVALFVFASQRVKTSLLVKYVPIALVLFYVGVRMTSTITPEGKVGGSFDISFVSSYVMNYYFGTNTAGAVFDNNYQGTGRGAGVVLYFNPERLTLHSPKEIAFGKGVYDVAVKKYGRFTAGGRSDYGIQHSGLIGEAGSLLYSMGYIGTLFLLLLSTVIIFTAKHKRLAWIIFVYFLWDFMFYYNQMLYFNASALIVLYVIFYSNSKNAEKKALAPNRMGMMNGRPHLHVV